MQVCSIPGHGTSTAPSAGDRLRPSPWASCAAAGAEVNHAINSGFTALFAAACTGHVQVVPVLVAARAEMDLVHSSGATALFMAAE
jgi:hypothetical protein